MEDFTLNYVNSNRTKEIEDILTRAVSLFRKTGLTELADKWDRILKTYLSKKILV